MDRSSSYRPRRPFFLSASTVFVIVLLASHVSPTAQIAAAFLPPMTDPGGPAGSTNVTNVYRLFADVLNDNNPALPVLS